MSRDNKKDFNKQRFEDFAQKKLNYTFNNIDLLIEALTHASYANENSSNFVKDNERLEFLGDAVLSLCISEALYADENNFTEGKMTKIRSLTVREESLVEVANNLGLSKYLLFGQGEEKTGGRRKSSNSEDAIEATIGAIFLDGGYEAAREFVLDKLKSVFTKAKSGKLIYDFKSKLFQVLQNEENMPNVDFRLINEEGPAHDKTFTVAVFYKDHLYPEASSSSKKTAEQLAAKLFLENYQNKNEEEGS